MASESDFPTRGKIVVVEEGLAKFAPAETRYQWHLGLQGKHDNLPIGAPIEVFIYVDARKLYTVQSGGNFVEPIVGPPRIIQGRVRFVSDSVIVVNASANFIVTLPRAN